MISRCLTYPDPSLRCSLPQKGEVWGWVTRIKFPFLEALPSTSLLHTFQRFSYQEAPEIWIMERHWTWSHGNWRGSNYFFKHKNEKLWSIMTILPKFSTQIMKKKILRADRTFTILKTKRSMLHILKTIGNHDLSFPHRHCNLRQINLWHSVICPSPQRLKTQESRQVIITLFPESVLRRQ